MSKETRKPSFTPAISSSESTGWTEPSTETSVATAAPHTPRLARLKAGVENVMDAVTYPASLAVTLVIFPVAAVANWWNE